MRIGAQRLFTGTGELRDAFVRLAGDKVVEVGHGTAGCDILTPILTPGFVDVHSHGGGGFNFSDSEHLATVLAAHRAQGTTTMVASLATSTWEDMVAQVRALTPAVADGTLAGIHLEGPWLAPSYKGAHAEELLRIPAPNEVAALLEESALGDGRYGVVMVTLAVELPQASAGMAEMLARKVVVAIGHGNISYADATAAFAAGASGVTHLFNAMPGLHHRAPGPVLAALQNDEVWLELICDGTHVDLDLVRYVFDTAAARVVLVTDAMAAAGCSDGDYRLGALQVEVRDGVARLTGTNTIAGSTLTMARAVRTAVAAGVELGTVMAAATMNPARYLRLDGVGHLGVGAQADAVCLDENLQVTQVIARGVRC